MKKIIFFVIISTLFFGSLLPCPFFITNDTEKAIIVTDYGKQAVYIQPNETKTIDPTLKGWIAPYIFNEKLNFFVENKPGEFYLKYQLTEYYCVEDWKEKNQFTLSQIKKLIDNPTQRLKVDEFEKPKENHAHNHEHVH